MDLSKPVDRAFTKALPKVELHAHLSGSITRECLHEIWMLKKAKDPGLQVEDPLVLMPLGKVDYNLQIFFQVFSKSIYQLCNDLPSLRHATSSVLHNFRDDGVRYLELRTTPRAVPDLNISKEKYVTTVLDCIDEFRLPQGGKSGMSVYLILSIDRSNSASEAMEVVDLAVRHRARGVVGVDLCGNPTRGDVSVFRDAFAAAKRQGLKITLHFAETAFSGSRTELDTLLSYEPDRLGHVIYVPDEVKREIARRKLGLELCMSCNVHAKMTDGGFPGHHFGYWRHQQCPLTLSTDDVGFFCSPVSNEYLLAAEHFHLSRAEVIDLCRRGVDGIFGGDDEKERLRKLLNQFEAEMKW